jgi:hypothetical protein
MMSQRPDDFSADLGVFDSSEDLRPVYERLETDARAWSVTVRDETPLIAFARALPRRISQEAMRMQSQPDHPEWETTQRLPYTSPDDQPRQRPSRLRTWVAVVAAALVVALLGGSLYALQASRNNGTPVTPTATTIQATDTPLPTATATATPLPTVTAAQFTAACHTGQPGEHIYQFGDLYVSVDLTNVDYPAAKLPDGAPLKPFKLAPGTDQFRGLPPTPKVNPNLNDTGFFVSVCNASKSVSHRIEGVTVRIDQFASFIGDLNSWQFCDGWYENGHDTGGGCGGGFTAGEVLHATFDTHASAGATAPATFVRTGQELDGTPLPPLPLTRAHGQGVLLAVSASPPTNSGTYTFSFSVRVDGANLPFAPLPDELLLGPARKWTGAACLKPEMQAQIPAGSADAYICPES